MEFPSYNSQNQSDQTTTPVGESYSKIQQPEYRRQSSSWKFLPVLILIPFLVGILGGVWGALVVSKQAWATRIFGVHDAVQSSPLNIQTNATYSEQSPLIATVEKSSKAVVSIVASKAIQNNNLFDFWSRNSNQSNSGLQQVGAGTGFFVSSDGLILTNRHVVADESASYTVIDSEGKQYTAVVQSRDPGNDIAILKIEINNAPTLPLIKTEDLKVGQQVIAIGNSLGQYQNTVTTGIISGIGRTIVAGDRGSSEQLDNVIQTDAAINPGNSGGPLLNLAGQVIGINTAIDSSGESVGFAIPASDIIAAVDSYKKFGKINRPFLGVRYVMLNKMIAAEEKLSQESGAYIIRGSNNAPAIAPNSPAAQAGLAEGDIITAINGNEVTEKKPLSTQLRQFAIGDTVTVAILRNGKKEEKKITLGSQD